MKARLNSVVKIVLALVLAGFAPALLAGNVPSSPAPAHTVRTNTASTLVADIPQSVFIVPSSAKEGRNPFFPQSSVAAPIVKVSGAKLSPQAFVLNGITSPPKRTAMINGYTFEVGESREVKLANGTRVLVKCEEVGADSAVINAGGVRSELHLRLGAL